jgi:hypothetical protein
MNTASTVLSEYPVSESAEVKARFLPLDLQQLEGVDLATAGTASIQKGLPTATAPIMVTTKELLVEEPKHIASAASQKMLQQWLGRVLRVDSTEFLARLIDHSNSQRPDEEATIGVRDVDPSDRPLIREGAVFYLFVYEETRGGARRLVTDLRFRRLSTWTRSELANVRARSKERARKLGINASHSR